MDGGFEIVVCAHQLNAGAPRRGPGSPGNKLGSDPGQRHPVDHGGHGHRDRGRRARREFQVPHELSGEHDGITVGHHKGTARLVRTELPLVGQAVGPDLGAGGGRGDGAPALDVQDIGEVCAHPQDRHHPDRLEAGVAHLDDLTHPLPDEAVLAEQHRRGGVLGLWRAPGQEDALVRLEDVSRERLQRVGQQVEDPSRHDPGVPDEEARGRVGLNRAGGVADAETGACEQSGGRGP